MNKKIKAMVIIGTRPEAIKMTPLIKEFQKRDIFDLLIINTAQHRELVDQFLSLHKIKPDMDMGIMTFDQDPISICSKVMDGFQKLFKTAKPDILLVQGDTTTAMTAALVACYNKITVGHVEAGLRTYNIRNPFPEELNRQLISKVSDLHFAPTEWAMKNLIEEGYNKNNIFVTGNTGIDMLHQTLGCDIGIKERPFFHTLKVTQNKIVLVTVHRRENHGQPLINICNAILALRDQYKDLLFVWPVHPNPNVSKVVDKMLEYQSRITLINSEDYDEFIYIMQLSHLILTDSGGIQEEAATLGKPTLVLRENTERAEALYVGSIKVIGTNTQRIADEVRLMLKEISKNPMQFIPKKIFGDGTASKQIADIITTLYRGAQYV
jgi:UDP-N-acetylglucosamine 2-epimerase (non-hydrolysing)